MRCTPFALSAMPRCRQPDIATAVSDRARWPVRARSVVSAMLALALAGAHAQTTVPQTGPVDTAFAQVDTLMRQYIASRGFPGAVVVIGYGDRIVYAQGYGWADPARQIPMSPWLEFRIASVSKPITATMVMRLVEQGRVSLDARAWDYLAPLMGSSQPADPRLRDVTVRQLLTHTWGLDRSVSADPMGSWYRDGTGTLLTSAREVLRFHLLRMQLNFNPGARHAYNNTGFVWLQTIAELVDGRPIEQQITQLLGPEPLSTGRVRFGEVVPSKITAAEPRYHDYAGAPQLAPVPGVYPSPAPAAVPRPDGSYTLVGYGGSGGYVVSPLTVVRFMQRLSGQRQPALLQPATFRQMTTEQALADGTRYWGLGVQAWNPWPQWSATDTLFTHTGAILGARNGFRSLPRAVGGPLLTVMVQTNGTPQGQGSETTDNISAEIVDPVIFAVDAIAGYRTRPEITPERLIAFGSVTEDHFADQLFDWGQRQFPSLFPGAASAGVYDGYRYRFFPATNTYVGVRQGQVYLYQPSLGPQISPVGPMVQWLPQALTDLATWRSGAAVRPGGAATWR